MSLTTFHSCSHPIKFDSTDVNWQKHTKSTTLLPLTTFHSCNRIDNNLFACVNTLPPWNSAKFPQLFCLWQLFTTLQFAAVGLLVSKSSKQTIFCIFLIECQLDFRWRVDKHGLLIRQGQMTSQARLCPTLQGCKGVLLGTFRRRYGSLCTADSSYVWESWTDKHFCTVRERFSNVYRIENCEKFDKKIKFSASEGLCFRNILRFIY